MEDHDEAAAVEEMERAVDTLLRLLDHSQPLDGQRPLTLTDLDWARYWLHEVRDGMRQGRAAGRAAVIPPRPR